MAVYLPAGATVWMAMGGPAAWSPEMYMMSSIEYSNRFMAWAKTKAASHGKPPKPLKPPQDTMAKQTDGRQAKSKALAIERANEAIARRGD